MSEGNAQQLQAFEDGGSISVNDDIMDEYSSITSRSGRLVVGYMQFI